MGTGIGISASGEDTPFHWHGQDQKLTVAAPVVVIAWRI